MRICGKVKRILQGGICPIVLYNKASDECKKRIQEDIEHYLKKSNEKDDGLLALFFDSKKLTFRNVFYYRLEWDKCKSRWLSISKKTLPPLATVEIWGDIDGGLKINHNYCVINVNKCGKGLDVMQGVTVGANGGAPCIGDDVIIFPNATVIGNIRIGDKAVIGAGSLVNKDVPENAVVAGNPFRILSYDRSHVVGSVNG